jgi:hypothetical protein
LRLLRFFRNARVAPATQHLGDNRRRQGDLLPGDALQMRLQVFVTGHVVAQDVGIPKIHSLHPCQDHSAFLLDLIEVFLCRGRIALSLDLIEKFIQPGIVTKCAKSRPGFGE